VCVQPRAYATNRFKLVGRREADEKRTEENQRLDDAEVSERGLYAGGCKGDVVDDGNDGGSKGRPR